MTAGYYRPDRAPAAASDGHGAGGPDHLHGPNGFDLHALSGNLCRCTGYRPIRDAAYALGSPAPEDPLARRRQAPATPARPTRGRSGEREFLRPAAPGGAPRLLRGRPGATLVAGS